MEKQSPIGPDIAGLITKLQEQITSLERKVDVLINRSLSKPAESKPAPQSFSKPLPQPGNTFAQAVGRHDNRFQPHTRPDNRFQSQAGIRQDNYFLNGNRQDNRFQTGSHDNRQRERILHKAICAECKKECEVPFRPIEGRPIYCQGCFARRKAITSFKPNFDKRPQELIPARTTLVGVPYAGKSQTSEKKKSDTNKKPAGKKKTVTKKKLRK
ncbi:MAG: CxxC-x17-CxxC domain-containing protein [Candidatus Omnitrophota bacterium]|nr:hypothetical protein [Candidatus Omnitrophota bacterium]